MKIYENGSNWIIEDELDTNLLKYLTEIIDKNLNNLPKNKNGYSTTGDNAEQYWIIKNGDFFLDDENFKNIKHKYKDSILNRLKKAQLINDYTQDNGDIKEKNCWSVIGEKNSYHTPHFHNNGNYSGISTLVYLKVPEKNIENEPENNLYLIMNSGPNNKFYHNKPKFIMINPTVGKLLIFPDWIIHGTLPQSEGIRQTFNIDYQFIHKRENNNTLKYY